MVKLRLVEPISRVQFSPGTQMVYTVRVSKFMSQNHPSFLHSLLFSENGEPRRKIFHSIKARANAERTNTERLADWMTSSFGSMTFLLVNALVFVIWILINTNKIKGIIPFDPFPFNLLTMVVSLEAIFLAVFVLISQNRSSKVDDLRAETHLQLNLISEREITKLMKIMILLSEKEGIDLSQDLELQKMLKPTSEEGMAKKLEKEIF